MNQFIASRDRTRVFVAAVGIAASVCATQVLAQADTPAVEIAEKNGKLFLQFGEELFEIVPDTATLKFADGVTETQKEQFYSDHGLRPIRENALGVVDVRLENGETSVDVVERLEANRLLEFIELNATGKYLLTPDDPMYEDQWGLANTGQTGGTPGADIGAPAAWDITTGEPDVVVGVLDSGVDIDHFDLECNVWVNPGEDLDGDAVVWDIADINGVDDDGNGLVDDIVGWDFHNGNNDPRGPFFHGTHVAGIIGACTNNGDGIAGIAGGFDPLPGVKLMTLGVGDGFPDGGILDDAILYAAENGARVISMSLSVPPSAAIDMAIEAAHDAGVFINNAAGNSFCAPVSYPANHPNVVAVGATNHLDVRSPFSDCGPQLEVVAPGQNILSTRIGDAFGVGNGTSYASPLVAGVAALAFSIDPTLTNERVRECINETADDEVGNPAEDTPGRDDFYGFGRLNAEEALQCVDVIFCDPTTPGAIIGTPGGDSLVGTPGDDVIIALGGDDTVFGLGGNDCIVGGPGADNIVAGGGDDEIDGGEGADRIVAGAGNDIVSGGLGDDVVLGGSGADDLMGDAGNDTVSGQAGDDSLDGGAGEDTVVGGPGTDLCVNGPLFVQC